MKRLLTLNMSGTKILSRLLFLTSVCILVGVVYFAMNIQVIKDWSLTLPSGPIHAGDTIVVASRYTKLKQVKGTSVRSLECESTPGIFVSYQLNKVAANRAPGSTGTGVVVKMPTVFAGINKLPDTCHVCIALTYPVLPGRTVPYFKCTKNFTLLPVVSNQTSTAGSQSQTSVSEGSVSDSSFSNTTPQSPPPQSNNVQAPQPAPTKPSLLQRILNPTKNLIGDL